MTLTVTELTIHHGAICAISDVSFTVPKGQLTAVIGANGAGKTTLLRTLSGLNKSTHGTATWNEHNLLHSKPETIVRHGAVSYTHLTLTTRQSICPLIESLT